MDGENNANNTESRETVVEEGQKNTEQPEKTFTQKEVVEIVEKRLRRERKKFTGLLNGDDPREIELAEREKAVAIRETRAEVRGLLDTKGLPAEALELLDYTDKDACEKSIEVLEEIVKNAVAAKVSNVLRGGEPPKRAGLSSNSVRSAFGL